jgi:hypothetical protein
VFQPQLFQALLKNLFLGRMKNVGQKPRTAIFVFTKSFLRWNEASHAATRS